MNNEQSLFDEFGRRIPPPGMRLFSEVPSRTHYLVQPELDYEKIYARFRHNLGPVFHPKDFTFFCNLILNRLQKDPAMCNLLKGVHVPFIAYALVPHRSRKDDILYYVETAGRAFEDMFPGSPFHNMCSGKLPENIGLAEGSRYRRFEETRVVNHAAGWYFPNCLSGYDIASQRLQMASLPEMLGLEASIALSGAVDAAAAIIGSPDLLVNKEAYPHHLCLSAIQGPDPRFVYSFESSNPGLWFNRRSQMLTPTVTQVSEQWAGGLTVFI